MDSRLSFIAVLLLAGGGCAANNEDSIVEPGVLYVQGQDHIVLPSSVAANQEFVVTVQSFGTSCYVADSTQILIASDSAVIAVFDRHPTGNCVANLVSIEHTGLLTFSTAGMKSVVVRGWDSGHVAVDISTPVQVQ